MSLTIHSLVFGMLFAFVIGLIWPPPFYTLQELCAKNVQFAAGMLMGAFVVGALEGHISTVPVVSTIAYLAIMLVIRQAGVWVRRSLHSKLQRSL